MLAVAGVSQLLMAAPQVALGAEETGPILVLLFTARLAPLTPGAEAGQALWVAAVAEATAAPAL